MKFILFRKVKKEAESRGEISIFAMMGYRVPGEDWKESNEKDKAKEVLEFICFVDNAKDVAKAVRKSPLCRYVLFRGEATEIKVAMPVFADGVALDSMMEEWGDTPSVPRGRKSAPASSNPKTSGTS